MADTNFLDSFGEAPAPESNMFDSMAPTVSKSLTPVSDIRNKAAALALIGGTDPVKTYGSVVEEQRYNNKPIEETSLGQQIYRDNEQNDLQGVMSVLGDKNVPFETKRKAISSFKQPSPLNDISGIVMAKALVSPSGDESDRAEAARTSLVDRMVENLRLRQQAQDDVNRFIAGRDTRYGKVMKEGMVEAFVPGVSSEFAARMESRGAWESFKSFWAPGSATKEKQIEYLELSPKDSALMISNLISDLENVDGILFDKADSYNKIRYLDQVASGEVMGTVETIFENIQPWLSALGLAVDIPKAAKQTKFLFRKLARSEELKAADEVVKGYDAAKAAQATTAPSKGFPDPILSKVSTPDQKVAAKAKQIDALVQEKAALLGDVNLADRAAPSNLKAELNALTRPDTNPSELASQLKKANPRLSSKEARTEAAKRIEDEMADYEAKKARLERLIETNRASSTTEQRIADIEKQIDVLKKGVPDQAGSLLNPITAALRHIEWNQTVRLDPPSSVGNVIGAANPEMARNLFTSIVRAPDDSAAKAIYGTTREEAIVAKIAPQIVSDTGAVTTEVTDIERLITKGEGLEFKSKELKSAFQFAEERFKNVEGLVPNEAMGGIRTSTEGDTISFDAVFGTKEGGFATVKEAMEQAKYALKDFGVTDDNLEILGASGIHHVPVDVKEVGDTVGNYMVRVKVPYQVSMHDVGSIDWVNSKFNVLDQVPQLLWKDSGQAARWVMDAASMLHPVYTGAGVRAEDIGSKITTALLKEAEEFTGRMDKFSKARQSAINEYLTKQNLLGVADDPVHLSVNFTVAERDAITAFRNFWDTAYAIENRSVVLKERAANWKIIDNANIKQVAKPIHENFKGKVGEVYDAASQKAVKLSTAEADALYSSGGFYARLRRPTAVNGKQVEHIIVRNTPQEYLRALNDNDELLKRRESYYQLHYKAPKFVDVVTRDVHGAVVTRRSVAVANDTGEAKAFTARNQLKPGEEWDIRNDVKTMASGSDEWYDINQAGGRMATRMRGDTLEVAGNPAFLGQTDYLVNPVDSAVRAARSIGNHTSMSHVLENMKQRFINQYGKFLKDDGFGGKKFPSNFGEIGAKGDRSRDLRDARTVYGQINFLENGYLNGADDVVKSIMGMGADLAAEYKLYPVERGLNKLAETSPTGALKGAVFKSTIAAHPVRQALIQMHQSVRMASYLADPRLMAKASKNLLQYGAETFKGGKSAFRQFVEDSGMVDAVTQHNLIREVTANYIDHSSKVLRKIGTPVRVAQEIGFVAGEKFSTIAHLSAVYEKYLSKGEDLNDLRTRSKAFSEARAIMGDMNKAGDMPYNQNWAAFVLQFAQVPHKMFLQITNRRIPASRKARLVAGDMLFWGLPTWAIQNSFTEEMIPDREMRMKLIEGAESALINTFLQKEFGGNYRIDTSSFSPNDMSGWYSFIDSLFQDSSEEVVMNSPAGRLLGQNGRVQHAFHMMGRYFRPFFDEDATPVEFMTTVSEVAKVFSGFNDFQKAKLIYELGQRRDTKGIIIENNVPKYAAWFQFFGLGGQDTKWMYETLKTAKNIKKNEEEEWKKVYTETLKAYSAMEGKGPEDGRTFTAYTGMLLSIYKDNPKAQAKMMEWARNDALDTNYKLYDNLARTAGAVDLGERRRMIETAPIPEEQKQQLIDNLNSYSNIKSEDE